MVENGWKAALESCFVPPANIGVLLEKKWPWLIKPPAKPGIAIHSSTKTTKKDTYGHRCFLGVSAFKGAVLCVGGFKGKHTGSSAAGRNFSRRRSLMGWRAMSAMPPRRGLTRF